MTALILPFTRPPKLPKGQRPSRTPWGGRTDGERLAEMAKNEANERALEKVRGLPPQSGGVSEVEALTGKSIDQLLDEAAATNPFLNPEYARKQLLDFAKQGAPPESVA